MTFRRPAFGDGGLGEPLDAAAGRAGEGVGAFVQPVEVEERHAGGIEQDVFVLEGCALAVRAFERVAVYVHG